MPSHIWNDILSFSHCSSYTRIKLTSHPVRLFAKCIVKKIAREWSSWHTDRIVALNTNFCQYASLTILLLSSFQCFWRRIIQCDSQTLLLLIRKFSRGLYFQSFVKIKPSLNGKITLSFFDIGKSGLSPKYFTSLIYLLMIFSRK